jgi:hypothetical protein
MSQSENQPLIPPEARYNDPEDPPADDGELRSQSTFTRWRAKTAESLESPRLHKIVIGLVRMNRVLSGGKTDTDRPKIDHR